MQFAWDRTSACFSRELRGRSMAPGFGWAAFAVGER